ncbi:PLP-dependent transferase [Jeotgalibaca ciconiae]|uniref:Methionine biosynthesis PLP-dependent protein n=1 Tax=Jeotgalibaca ciconiae TaxID=2496265 RepID=A0A3Q9BK99_9LACT|nr:PLP-dependent transferase [Jeotgalibaca ciconiae]AZP04227.1 methionine biosynthesis PLP-dependent protein [Jeotgalibaca ciconiae]HJB24161.1 PLP-dependent transferase [Candidatus Jeotgalibaca pullicola]
MSNFNTFLAQIGNHEDPTTGAVSPPIYLSSTFAHPGLGQSTGYDYTRTNNPTRDILEKGLSVLEGGTQAVATSSGMSAIQLVFQLFPAGSEFLVSRDLYGGSFRYFKELEDKRIAKFHYFTSLEDLKNLLTSEIDAVFVETPTNPLMQEIDLEKVSVLAKEVDAILIVDNTFLTPLRQRPLELGAQIVVHSGTKYLTGHNDVLAGVVVTNDETIGEKLQWLSNTTGPTLSAFDCWLFIRSLKTLPLRLDRQESNAQKIVDALKKHPQIKEVLYPGKGAMISIRLQEEERVASVLSSIKVFTFAESLGGVESLITYPTTQTHADVPKELRESYGLTEDLLRISVGIEDADDLVEDLKQALESK